ncbi:MAG: GspE/PulE family protein [Pseudomonadota bacterium]
MSERPKKIRLGDLLVEQGAISNDQLMAALQEQKSTGNKLGRVLIDSGYITEDKLLNILARQLNIDYIDLKTINIQPEVAKLIPEVQARRHRVIALEADERGVLIGMTDPSNLFAYDEVARLVNRPLRLAVVKEAELLHAIDTVYRRTSEINNIAAELDQQILSYEESVANRMVSEGVTDAPVVKLLNTILEDAVQVRASDIHIEPDEQELRVRFRIDGVLRVQTTTEPRIASALVSRLKLMAGLDISEKRLPQDGRFNVRLREQSIDVRLSTLPLPAGESAVMRLLNQSNSLIGLSQLGMEPDVLARFRRLSRSPHGLMLVTGPTGSGKTTTLYALLKELNDPSVKIITAEDPVEYRLKGINQVQVNAKIDLTFSKVLRTILRQDPDIVLVGEMRDRETIEIGLRAAMTGHFVMSTLHTNDAVSSAIRLIDMGAEPFLIAGALRGIVAQRLVRKICGNCAAPDVLDPQTKVVLADMMKEKTDVVFMRGRGCPYCNNSGYTGRIGIYEFLEMDGDLAQALHNGDLIGFGRLAASRPGFKSIKQNTYELAVKGVTTVDELIRVGYGAE